MSGILQDLYDRLIRSRFDVVVLGAPRLYLRAELGEFIVVRARSVAVDVRSVGLHPVSHELNGQLELVGLRTLGLGDRPVVLLQTVRQDRIQRAVLPVRTVVV